MFDDMKAYFVENILASYKDYCKIKNSHKLGLSNDLRTAINLATSLYHLREHIPAEIRKKRDEYSKACNDYNLLGDIVNASKHGILTHGNPQIKDVNNIYESAIFTEYKDSIGEYQHIEKSVFVKLDNGSERDLHEIIINVMNMWINEFNSLGILKNYPLQKVHSTKIPRRTKKSGLLNMQSMKDLRFGATFKMQKYNYEKGIVEPVDLTGASAMMRIYKNAYTISLTATKENKEIKIEIEVDDKQLKQYQSLKSQEDQIKFFIEKAKEQGKIINWENHNE